jgi:hypothetical protein
MVRYALLGVDLECKGPMCTLPSLFEACGSAKRDSDFDTTGASVSEYTKNACVFGEKESAVSEDVDLLFRGGEEACPDLAGDGPAMRVDGSQLCRARPRS